MTRDAPRPAAGSGRSTAFWQRLGWAIAAVAASVAAWAPGTASAAPLAKEACAALTEEHATLVAAGLPETLKKGPDWGKTNLDAARLKEVKRFIELEEQLLFRCGLAKERGLPVASESDETDTSTDSAAEKPDVPPPLPRRKPARVAKSAAKPVAKPAPAPSTAATAPAASSAGKPPPVPQRKPERLQPAKSKPKPKVDDAYRPPPKTGLPANVIPAPPPNQ